MPCTYYLPGEELEISYKNNQRLMKQVNELTRLLCAATHILEDRGLANDMLKVKGLDEWFKSHQEHDKRQGR